MPVAESELRTQFFDSLYGNDTGYLCIATKNPLQPKSDFSQKFFKYPDELEKAEEYIISQQPRRDCYFCINLLTKAERIKGNCKPTNLAWADLDNVDPTGLAVQPAVIIESSPGRYQAVWRLSMVVQPDIAESYSKRIAYSTGADKSGWDLTQLLRIPFTFNFKYKSKPMVNLIRALDTEVQPLLFEALPPIEVEDPELDEPLPGKDELPPVESVLYKFRTATLNALMSQEPGAGDWSSLLWKLIHTCMEAGMENEEVLVICRNSACDKYDRDNRPVTDLWRDILKARKQQNSLSAIMASFKPLIMPEFVAEPSTDTFISQYRAWGEEATDAVPEFHDLSAFMLLSSIIANSVRLETSYGVMVPNLWGLILGDSTLTRKTTAMRMVIDILSVIDSECLIATDGSAEGLLTGLEQRPNKTSVFYKDEVSGFFDSINRKDYLAGMPETLTALYDVPGLYTRRLRKETIRIESPAFVFFGGGVRDKVFDAITENYIVSGFLPRFLVVSGDTDLDRLRRTGPNTESGIAKRAGIVSRAADIFEQYATEVTMSIGGQKVRMPPRITASLTNEAWERYGEIEEKMVNIGIGSAIPGLALPTFERLSRSLLKMAVCLGAERQIPKDERITIETYDIDNAAFYVQKWGWYSIEMISNAGKGIAEKQLDKILRAIERYPGITRSTLMQHYHLNKKEADLILGTLEERMMVRKEGAGRGFRYWLAG